MACLIYNDKLLNLLQEILDIMLLDILSEKHNILHVTKNEDEIKGVINQNQEIKQIFQCQKAKPILHFYF